MSLEHIHRIVILGVGLIGGSVGLALKRAKFPGKIVGLDQRWSPLKRAIEQDAVDYTTLDFEEALGDADLLLISTPVNAIPTMPEEAIKFTRSGCIIMDTGITKGQLVAEIEKTMPEGIHFVGAHPMVGSHRTGVAAAGPNLFEGSLCIITATESTNTEAIHVVSELWETVGARVEIMSPQEYDNFAAAVNYLPYVVACALVQVVDDIESDGKRAIDFTATGFAHATRIASSDPRSWGGILLQNADIVSSKLGEFEKEIANLRELLDDRDEEKLLKKLKQAKQIRDEPG